MKHKGVNGDKRVGTYEGSPAQGHPGHWGGQAMYRAVVYLCKRLPCLSQNLQGDGVKATSGRDSLYVLGGLWGEE